MSDLTSRGQLIRDDSNFPVGWKPFYASATGATLVKSSPGFLHTLTFNNPVATTTVALCNTTTTATLTGTFGVITVPASPQPVTLTYDTVFDKGLVLNVSTAASDITVSYV